VSRIAPKVVHFKKHSFDVFIARPSKWGNPFSHKAHAKSKYKVATKAEALYKHREWVLSQPDLISEIKKELKGKILGCWCDEGSSCHGHILVKIANDLPLDDAPENEDPENLLF